MEESIEKVIESEKELMSLYLKKFLTADTIGYLDKEDLEFFKITKSFMDTVNDCLIDYGNAIDKQNEKLDRILKILEKKES